MPRPIWVHAGRGQEASLFLWTTKEQAAQIDAVRLASDATLTPLAEKKPIDVKEVGSASASAGKLFVMFCPNVQDDEDANSNACKAANQHDTNSDDRPRPAYRYESINQIAAKWNAAFEKHGLAIQAVKVTKPGLNVGHAMLNVGGQIEVKFKGQLAEDVVKTIKDHPQAASLSWGKPFTVMYCPGCGMG